LHVTMGDAVLLTHASLVMPPAPARIGAAQIYQCRDFVLPEKWSEESRIRLRRACRFPPHDPVEIVENVGRRSHQRRFRMRIRGTPTPREVISSNRENSS